MTNFSVESKSQLAKLMASEDLQVVHAPVQTASFDLKSRTLTCPIWKDMDGDTYDLLLGHEVGHALETPEEGWHGATSSKGKNFKHFLNVIEDARIEKKIKRRYPGLRKSFVNAYNGLFNKGFFGVKEHEIDGLFFIDRLNLYTKSSYTLPVKFTDEESLLVKEVESCETWEDVVFVTEKIFGFSKDEQDKANEEAAKKLKKQMAEEGEGEESDSESSNDDFDYDEPEEDFGGSTESDSDSEDNDGTDKSDADTSGNGDYEFDESSDEENDSESEESDVGAAINRYKESAESYKQPVCKTDEEFRRNENSLLDEKSKRYIYANVPTANLQNIVTPANRVNEQILNHYSESYPNLSGQKLLNEFRAKNDRYIGLLAKEFEMRKAAKSFSKSKLSNTGDIDISKVYNYKIDDQIFRKVMRVPKGKSHGLVMLVDKSGSMYENMAGTIEQLLILVSFCRKVNIPFVAYGFGDETGVRKLDFPNADIYDRTLNKQFTSNNGDLALSTVFLREMINSRMSASDFNKAMIAMIMLMHSYTKSNGYRNSFRLPESESLSNTPLNSALVALKPVVENFKKVNNIEISNIIIMHDGDSDSCNAVHNENYYDRFYSNDNLILREQKSKFQTKVPINEYRGVTISLMEMLQQTTNSKVVGFYITTSKNSAIKNAVYKYYENEKGEKLMESNNVPQHIYNQKMFEAGELGKVMRKQKFLESYTKGYNRFYLIPGGSELSVEEDSIEVEGKITSNKLATAFIKFSKKKQVSRVLVSRFIEQIAV
jgi:hypothetical protein